MTELLLKASNLRLQVPIFQSDDRKMLANPRSFLSDLYFSRTKRGLATLLEDISFTLHKGERLGIIGANGAGKSTLLRVLAGIYQPTSGRLEINGTAKGLFSISLGMHPEATGLENIYMRGLQMGLTLKETRLLVPEVVAFSELEDDIEKPINTYSAGMRLRLAFSVSTMVDPDILLLDEWIGAGDARFRAKARKRMMGLVDKSSGLVLATHNVSLMKNLCSHGMVLRKGRVAFCGDLDEALDVYKKEVNDKP